MKNNILNHVKRFLALTLALVSIVGFSTVGMPVEASAATTSKSVSISSISVNSSGLYYVKSRTADLLGDPKDFSWKYCTLQKGALVAVCGTQGNYYKVNMGTGRVYYLKKTDVASASSTTKASLYYTTKNAALRANPYETGSKVATLPKGSPMAIVGKVTNSYSNTWLILHWNGGLYYLYSGNAKSTSKVTMKISGDEKVSVGNALTLKCTMTPSAVTNVTWSSSNTKIATASGGKVTPKLAGSCTITAKIGNAIEVRFPITVTYKWPTSGRVTSEYGWRYLDGNREFHGGIDIRASEGTNIKVVADGKVTYAGWHDSYGNLVIVSHADGSKTYYAHCSKLLVSKNQNVTAGQVIAKVGSTGRSTGNHLHFEIRINGNRVDPRKYLE